jgi:hypothetical protein
MIGVDLGAKHVGIAIASDDQVLVKGEIELRQDVKSLLDTRRIYRRSRRNRKTRYCKPKFQNRKKEEGWLPPSIQSRIDCDKLSAPVFISSYLNSSVLKLTGYTFSFHLNIYWFERGI